MIQLIKVHSGKRFSQKLVEDRLEPLNQMGKQVSGRVVWFDVAKRDYSTDPPTPVDYHYIKISFDDIDRIHAYIHEGENAK